MKLPNNYSLPRRLFDWTEAEKNSAPAELMAALYPVGGKRRDGNNDDRYA